MLVKALKSGLAPCLKFGGGASLDGACARRQWRTGKRISAIMRSGFVAGGKARRSSEAATGPFVLFSMGIMPTVFSGEACTAE